jgi:hypothetical protein
VPWGAARGARPLLVCAPLAARVLYVRKKKEKKEKKKKREKGRKRKGKKKMEK